MGKDKPPYLGFGLGLRPQHYAEILNGAPPINWFEIISENYMIEGGQPLRMLDQICERYPVVMHGVSLSIASTSPLDLNYLPRLKRLAERVNPAWISDHLCWTGVHGVNLHDLLPVPYTRDALDHVVERVSQVQDFLGRRLTLGAKENRKTRFGVYRQAYVAHLAEVLADDYEQLHAYIGDAGFAKLDGGNRLIVRATGHTVSTPRGLLVRDRCQESAHAGSRFRTYPASASMSARTSILSCVANRGVG